jgi:hypothetical protein
VTAMHSQLGSPQPVATIDPAVLVARCERLLDRCDDYAGRGIQLIEIADVRAYLSGEQ